MQKKLLWKGVNNTIFENYLASHIVLGSKFRQSWLKTIVHSQIQKQVSKNLEIRLTELMLFSLKSSLNFQKQTVKIFSSCTTKFFEQSVYFKFEIKAGIII